MQKRHGRVHLRVISAPLNSQRTLSAGRECRAGVVQTDLWRAVSVCSSSWLRVSSLSWFSRRLRGRKREVVAKQDQEDDTTEEHWEHFQAFLVRLSLPLESCIYAACTVLSAHGGTESHAGPNRDLTQNKAHQSQASAHTDAPRSHAVSFLPFPGSERGIARRWGSGDAAARLQLRGPLQLPAPAAGSGRHDAGCARDSEGSRRICSLQI